jgi:HAE1 family hydrophobic/amphiphilic exporter-1
MSSEGWVWKSQRYSTLCRYYGGLYTTDFNKFGKQYRVMIQAKAEDRANLESINNIYVMNNSGQKWR